MSGSDDFVKRLREDTQYKEAMGRARSPAERKMIAKFVEGFVGSVGAILGPAIEQARTDPEFAERLRKALNEGKDVLTDEGTEVSGSLGT